MINRLDIQRGGKRSLFEDSFSPSLPLSVFCSFVTIQSFIFIVFFFASPPYSVSNKTSDEAKESINDRLVNFYKIEKPNNTYE